MALSIDESASAGSKLDSSSALQPLAKLDLDNIFSPFDLKRLDSYANNMLDYHVILDMLPTIATLYFTGRLKSAVKLSGVQTSLLVAIGLQRKGFEDVEKELGLNNSQLLAMFVKVIRKVSTHFRSLVEGAVAETLPEAMELDDESGVHEGENGIKSAELQRFKPLAKKLDEELAEGGEEIDQAERERVRSMIDALPLDKYTIDSENANWEEAEQKVLAAQAKGGKDITVSIKTGKSSKRKAGEAVEEAYKEAMGTKEGKSKKSKGDEKTKKSKEGKRSR